MTTLCRDLDSIFPVPSPLFSDKGLMNVPAISEVTDASRVPDVKWKKSTAGASFCPHEPTKMNSDSIF